MTSFARMLLLGALSVFALGTTAQAQTVPAPPRNPAWEIEVHGGLGLARIPSKGSTALPPAGAPLATSSPIFPSRKVSSWYFGDGAKLLNDTNAEFGVAARVTPLDAILGSVATGGDPAAAFGMRVRRHVKGPFAAEIGVDVLGAPPGLAEGLEDAARLTDTSVQAAISGLLSSGPFSNRSMTGVFVTGGTTGREIAATAGVNVGLGSVGPLMPYVTAGGGVLTTVGDSESIGMATTYAASIGGTTPMQESDSVTIRAAQKTVPVGMIGIGIRNGSTRWGLRVDARAYLGPNSNRLLLDASPTVTTGTPAGYVESFTSPSIQFSNNASTGRASSLSGPAIKDFATFTGTGLQTRFSVTMGISLRF